MIVADTLSCQKDTAKAIIRGNGDYLLNVKDNQKLLKEDIEDYVQDDDLRTTMDTATSVEKNSGRIERRLRSPLMILIGLKLNHHQMKLVGLTG